MSNTDSYGPLKRERTAKREELVSGVETLLCKNYKGAKNYSSRFIRDHIIEPSLAAYYITGFKYNRDQATVNMIARQVSKDMNAQVRSLFCAACGDFSGCGMPGWEENGKRVILCISCAKYYEKGRLCFKCLGPCVSYNREFKCRHNSCFNISNNVRGQPCPNCFYLIEKPSVYGHYNKCKNCQAKLFSRGNK